MTNLKGGKRNLKEKKGDGAFYIRKRSLKGRESEEQPARTGALQGL